MASFSYDCVLLPGDGIGPEVIQAARRVLAVAAEKHAVNLRFTTIPCGGAYFQAHGRDWPAGSEQLCADADVLLLGAVGLPDPVRQGWPMMRSDGRMAGWSAVLGNRQQLDLYANVRRVRPMPGIRSRIPGLVGDESRPGAIDFVVVRENSEGLYAGIGHRDHVGTPNDRAEDVRLVTYRASERIMRLAFELAAERDGAPQDQVRRVTCVTKHNVLRGCQLFADVFESVAGEFPEVEAEIMLVDNFALRIVTGPEHFDVCVAPNLFGDIVSDLASVHLGGMGMAVGENLGTEHAMFEPVHGSAPDLAGRGQANPLATILAGAAAMRWLAHQRDDAGLTSVSRTIERAVRLVLASPDGPRTPDLAGGDASTEQVVDAVVRRVRSSSPLS